MYDYLNLCVLEYILLALLYGTLGIIIVIQQIQKVQKAKKAKKLQKIFNNLKTSKIGKINEKGKKLNSHASISTLCLFINPPPNILSVPRFPTEHSST